MHTVHSTHSAASARLGARALSLVLVLLAALLPLLASAQSSPPNVIVIICDDLNDSVKGMGGHLDALTPQIDHLMRAGVRFTNAHCNAPICGPSRASLWSGLLPSTTGYYGYNQQDNDWRDFPKMADAITLMEHFKGNGYTVWGSGKIFHNGHDDNSVFSVNPTADGAGPSDFGPFPWDGVSVASGNNQGDQHPDMPTNNWGYFSSTTSLANDPGDTPGYENYQWSLKDSAYSYTSEGGALGIEGDVRDLMPDEVTAQWAENKLGQTHSDPFLMVVGMNRPHGPFYAPDEFFELFRDENGNNTVSLPPYLENDLDDLPEIVMGTPYGTISERGYMNGIDKYKLDYGNGANEWWLNFVQGYLACVAFADHQVGVIWDALQASDYADNTIVILTSDHGYHLGEKNHTAKTTAWEETTRVPLVVDTPEMRAGGRLASVAGQTCNAPVSLVDIYPTLNALCGLPADPNGGADKNNIALDGHDFSPLLEAPLAGQWDGPSVSLSHLHNARVDWPDDTKSPWALNHHSVRSKDYHYILYSDGSEELYDHSIDPISGDAVDPNEWTNQAANAAYASNKAALKQQLFQSLGLADTDSLVANGDFEGDLNNWVAVGSASASLDTSNTLAGSSSALVTGGGSASVDIVDYQFNETSGTALSALTNAGTDTGDWNFGSFQTQNGALNVGYTQYYKGTAVDGDGGVYRTHTLVTSLTTGQYQLDVDLSNWDLRKNWDPNANSAADKGIQFSLLGSGGTSANVRFDTQGTTGFRAAASGTGAALTQVNGGVFDNALNRFEATGGLLRILADLDTGVWTASANDGEGGTYKTIVSGTGLLDIAGIRFNSLSPSTGSWGGAGAGQATDPTVGGTAGDFVRIDSVTLASVGVGGDDSGLQQDMLAQLEPGKRYHISAWVKLASASTGIVELNMKQTIGSDEPTYPNVGSVTANDSEFLLIEGDYTVPENLTELALMAQGVDFYIDYVQVFEYETPHVVASAAVDLGGGTASVTWNATLGVAYTLQQSTDLAAPNGGWTHLQTITAYERAMALPVTLDLGETQAFWRVVQND